MHTLRMRITLVLVACVLMALSAMFVSDYSLINRLIDQNTNLSAELSTQELATEIDDKLQAVKQSTDAMEQYAAELRAENSGMLDTQEGIDSFLARTKTYALNEARNTYGAYSAYYVLNPELYGPQQAFFVTRLSADGDFVDNPITEIGAYSPDDIEHVGWYYLPLAQGEPLWMSPYLNKNVDVWMISYVIPVYHSDGEALGVVGMDLDFNLIIDSIRQSDVRNENGSALLLDAEGKLLYHQDYGIASDELRTSSGAEALEQAVLASQASGDSVEAKWNGDEYRVFAKKLVNGMTLAVTIPNSELEASMWKRLAAGLAIALLVTALAIVLVVVLARTVTRPLSDLSKAAGEIASGNMDVQIQTKADDEVGALAQAFQKMVAELHIRMDQMNLMAFVDSLTGLGNRTAYTSTVETLRPEIERGTADFTFALLDLNYLKVANDKHGHEAGDALLQDAASIAVGVFGAGHVFRFGGDEFAVIVPGGSRNRPDYWVQLLENAIAAFNENQRDESPEGYSRPYKAPVSLAWGIVTFDPKAHKTYEDLFSQADQLMYECKKEQKSSRE